MDSGTHEQEALNLGQSLEYLRSVGVEKSEAVPIYFPDGLPTVLAAYDAAEGVLMLSDLADSPPPAGSYALAERRG